MKVIEGFSKYQIDEQGCVYGPRGHAIAPHICKGTLAINILHKEFTHGKDNQ